MHIFLSSWCCCTQESLLQDRLLSARRKRDKAQETEVAFQACLLVGFLVQVYLNEASLRGRSKHLRQCGKKIVFLGRNPSEPHLGLSWAMVSVTQVCFIKQSQPSPIHRQTFLTSEQ